jgi:arginase
MASIELLIVPYDSARRAERMGAGPHALLSAGLEERLRSDGFAATSSQLEAAQCFPAEIATAFELQLKVRDAVISALRENRLSIALTGNCNTGVVGALAAHNADDVGLVWFDAHSDAETPETTTSGFFDGMGFAVALGECWKPKLADLGWQGLDGRRAMLVGAREISPAARQLLQRREVSVISPEAAQSGPSAEALGPAVSQMAAAGVRRIHVHVDLDVLDPDLVGRANDYALHGGLSVEQLLSHIRFLLSTFTLVSASVASYDPSFDEDGAVCAAGREAIALLARGADPRAVSTENCVRITRT